MLLVAVWLLTAPLRRRDVDEAASDPASADRRADLEAERDSLYAQIREAEMDRRTQKLSEEDFRALDAELRAEAIEVLQRLDRLD